MSSYYTLNFELDKLKSTFLIVFRRKYQFEHTLLEKFRGLLHEISQRKDMVLQRGHIYICWRAVGALEKLEHLKVQDITLLKVSSFLHKVSEKIVGIVHNIVLGNKDTQIYILVEGFELLEVVILAEEVHLLLADLDDQVLLEVLQQLHCHSKRSGAEGNEEYHHVEISSSSKKSPEETNIVQHNVDSNLNVGILLDHLVDQHTVEHAELKHHYACKHLEVAVFWVLEGQNVSVVVHVDKLQALHGRKSPNSVLDIHLVAHNHQDQHQHDHCEPHLVNR